MSSGRQNSANPEWLELYLARVCVQDALPLARDLCRYYAACPEMDRPKWVELAVI